MAFDILHRFVTKLGYANRWLTLYQDDAPPTFFAYHSPLRHYNHENTKPYGSKVTLLWPSDSDDIPNKRSSKCFPHNFKSGRPPVSKCDPATANLIDCLREPEINPDIRRQRDKYCDQSFVKDEQGRPIGFSMYMLVPIYVLMEARQQGYMRLVTRDEIADTLAAVEEEQPPMVELSGGSSDPVLNDILDCDAWSLALYQLIPRLFIPNSPYATLGQALIEYLLAQVNQIDLYALWANEEIIGDVMQTNESRSRWNYQDVTVDYMAERTAWGWPHRLHVNQSHKISNIVLALTAPNEEMALTPPYQGSES